MLHEFLIDQRDTILDMAKEELKLMHIGAAPAKSEEALKLFFDEFINLLRNDDPFSSHSERGVHTAAAKSQAAEYMHLGYTVSEVVHAYGIFCQAITFLTSELSFPISTREFQRLNLSLDTAIAEAVTEFERLKTEKLELKANVRLGFLGHELRNCLQTITVALEIIESGRVGIRSNTSIALQNSVQRMAALVDKALTEVRLQVEPEVWLQVIPVFEVLSEVEVTAGFQARSRSLTLQVQRVSDIEIVADRQLIVSALANLVQNALKFTPSGGTIQIRVNRVNDRTLIEVQDQCGGLPKGAEETMFKPFVQNAADRTGLGLGLSITKDAIERCGGTLTVKDLPGEGCIFTMDLPSTLTA